MKIIENNNTTEIVEKKSRFICDLFYVENVDEAIKNINGVKKKYFDAKHHCYAYVLGENGDIVKYSDDGEPQGTAGKPMLDILKYANLTNVLAVVTRYFGGTLLGTGGLVRAYSEATKNCIDGVVKKELLNGYEIIINVNYSNVKSIENLASSYSDKVIEKEKNYLEQVYIKYIVNEQIFEEFKQKIINILKGDIAIIEKKISYCL